MEWLIVFSGGERFAWWDVWTRPGFRHVSACRYDARLDAWVFYDVKAGGTEVVVLAGADPRCVERLGGLMSVSTIVRFEARAHRWLAPPAFGCVGAMRHLLGVRGAFTPWGLFRHLLALGGELWSTPSPPWVPDDTQ